MFEPRRHKGTEGKEGKEEDCSLRLQLLGHEGTKTQRAGRPSFAKAMEGKEKRVAALRLQVLEPLRHKGTEREEGKEEDCSLRLQLLGHKGGKTQRAGRPSFAKAMEGKEKSIAALRLQVLEPRRHKGTERGRPSFAKAMEGKEKSIAVL